MEGPNISVNLVNEERERQMKLLKIAALQNTDL
jgi:hypothetical protein